jgi:hypothetical protein
MNFAVLAAAKVDSFSTPASLPEKKFQRIYNCLKMWREKRYIELTLDFTLSHVL